VDLPALSATLRTKQAEAIVVAGPNFRDEWPFDPPAEPCHASTATLA